MIIGWALLAAGLTCLAIAFVLGGLEERVFAAAQAASGVFELLFIHSDEVDIAVVIDLAVLAVILTIALRTRRVWPLIAASLSVAALMTEAAQVVVHASANAYGLLQGVWDLLANLVVAIGAVGLWRARRAARGSA